MTGTTRWPVVRAVVLAGGVAASTAWMAARPGGAGAPARYDFEQGLAGWAVPVGERGVAVRSSGDPERGSVLALTPDGDDVIALLPETASWSGVLMRGRFLFPVDGDAYLGFVYGHRRAGTRSDFGVLYVKGNESYAQPNPHRDSNVGRLLYPEMHVSLEGDARVVVGRWQTFRLEVMGRIAHLYIGPGGEPVLTFDLFETRQGAVGLQPRSVGEAVWVDDIEVARLSHLTWTGAARPTAPAYDPAALLVDWQVAGPFDRTDDDLARQPGRFASRWRPFASDARGAVVTGAVVDFHGPRTVGYFRTRVETTAGREAVLHLSTADDLAVWVNGRFHWFVTRTSAAWWDVGRNPDHAGRRLPLTLQAGVNEIVLRVRGGVYASGGFFARIEVP